MTTDEIIRYIFSFLGGGFADDARIYNRVLSAAEISQLYYYGLSGGLGNISGNCVSPSMPEGSSSTT